MLSEIEIKKLKVALSNFFAFHFNNDLSGENFESIFAFVKGAKVDPAKKSKKFFDVVKDGRGWSLKTLTDKSDKFFRDSNIKFDLVLQRADIEGKYKISMTETPQSIGNEIIKLYNSLLETFMEKQHVKKPLIGFLLRSYDNKNFIYFEKDLVPFNAANVKWAWTKDTNKSLCGSVDGNIRLIWYKTGRQLFGRYRVPDDAIKFSISWIKKLFDDTSR